MTVAVKPAADPKTISVVDDLVRRGARRDGGIRRCRPGARRRGGHRAGLVALQSRARQRAGRAGREGHPARQRARQDHQEAAQDLRHAARSFAREVGRHHRGRQDARHRQIRKAGRRRLRDHALDQSGRDAGQQGDDGDQGPQCHHHRGIAGRPEDDDEDRRLHARGAEEDRRCPRIWCRSCRRRRQKT